MSKMTDGVKYCDKCDKYFVVQCCCAETSIIKRTDSLLEKIISCDLRTEVGIDKAKKAIRLALRKGGE